MLKYFSNLEKTSPFDEQIDAVLQEMTKVGVDSDEYDKLMKRLKKLTDMKAKTAPKKVSRDTVALITGNLIGIVLIVAYEQKHVMSQKAYSHLNRVSK